MATTTFDELIIGDLQGNCLFFAPELISLYGKAHKLLASLQNEGGLPCLSFYDANGTERMKLTMDEAGQPAIALADGNDQSRLIATVDNEGNPSIALLDPMGTARLELRLLDEGTPSLAFDDKDGKLRLHVLASGNEPALLAFPPSGEERWHYLLSRLVKKAA